MAMEKILVNTTPNCKKRLKYVSIKHSLDALYYVDILFWHRQQKCRILDYLYYICGVVIFIGSINHLLSSYENGATFEKCSLDMSWLISLSFTFFAVTRIKHLAHVGSYVIELIDRNVELRQNSVKVEKIIKMANKVQNNAVLYTAILLGSVFLSVELEKCDHTTNPDMCGLALPSKLYFDLSERPYRDLYNIAILYLLVYSFSTFILGLLVLYFMIKYLELVGTEMQRSLRMSNLIQLRAMRFQKIKEIHQQQLICIEIWKNVLSMYKTPLIIQCLVTIINVPLIVIADLDEFTWLSIGHLSVYILATCVVGYMAEIINNVGENYRHDFFYACPWDGDLTNTKYLMLMNLNSSVGFKLELWQFFEFSNEIVLKVLRWSYSIVMVYIQHKRNKTSV